MAAVGSRVRDSVMGGSGETKVVTVKCSEDSRENLWPSSGDERAKHSREDGAFKNEIHSLQSYPIKNNDLLVEVRE